MDLIVLYFLAKRIGKLAIQKGLKSSLWKFYTVLAWIAGEMVGISMAINMFGPFTLKTVDWRYALMSLFFAFGGFLAIQFILEKKPDNFDDEINGIGVDDLQPPHK